MRLKDDYKKHNRLIIAYDFDDTISNFAKTKFPEAEGYANDRIIKLLKDYRNYAYFILYTARSGKEQINEALNYIAKYDIPINAVNENMPGIPFGSSAKIYYNVFLDDKCGLGWAYKALKQLLKEIKKEKKNERKA